MGLDPGKPMPLVSCLCVTEGRPAFMPWLLWCYDRQRYPHRELVIVDSSTQPFRPDGREDVRVVTLPPGTGVARKRNLALREAAGEIVAWFDDDDWQHPNRLAWLVEALQGGAVYAGARQGWFVSLQAGLCRFHTGLKNQMVFNSAAFRREAALEVAFPEQMPRASDTPWMAALAARFPAGAAWLDRSDLFFWLCHGENLSNPAYRKQFNESLDRLKRQIGADAWGDTDLALEALKARLAGRSAAHPVLSLSASVQPAETRRPPPALVQVSTPPQPPVEAPNPAGEDAGAEMQAGPPVSLLVKVTPADAPYLETIIRHIQAQARYPFCQRAVVVDRGRTPPVQDWQALDQALERLVSQGVVDTVLEASQLAAEMQRALDTYFPGHGGQVPLYACDGSPLASPLFGLEAMRSDWVLQTDVDIFFHSGPAGWVRQALDCLQQDPRLWVMMVHPGPPAGAVGRSLRGTNARSAEWDARMQIWRFQHATTRYFLCDRRRLRGMLAPLFLRQGFAPLEVCLSLALRQHAAFRGALGDLQSWHLHAQYHGDPFPQWAQPLARLVEAGRFPEAQRGEYDLRLDQPSSRQAWLELMAL